MKAVRSLADDEDSTAVARSGRDLLGGGGLRPASSQSISRPRPNEVIGLHFQASVHALTSLPHSQLVETVQLTKYLEENNRWFLERTRASQYEDVLEVSFHVAIRRLRLTPEEQCVRSLSTMTDRYRKVLMVYPAFHRTHWSLYYSLPLLGKRSIMAPLGLITIAAITPPEYEIRLVDLNCEPLSDDAIAWADMVCFSAMIAQKRSLFEAARRCREAGKLVVFGGPLPTASPEDCEAYCDAMVLNEGEQTWPRFLEDLAAGNPQKRYTSEERADVTQTPIPRFDLLKIEDYLNVPIQFARGCPFECEFCDIPVMLGRKPRTKTPAQVLAELDAVYATGFRGGITLVDDNFIGKKNEARKLLREICKWNEAHGNPFFYGTQVTVTLAEDDELLQLMVQARFFGLFMGIETPSLESLKETNKYQNLRRSLLDSIHKVQSAGGFVYAGFIVGFDNDTESIFDQQIEFVRQAAIPVPNLALLFALPRTPLRHRMMQAGRLRPPEREEDPSGYNTNFDTNIVTILPRRTLLEGYRKIISTHYKPAEFLGRTYRFFLRLPANPGQRRRFRAGMGIAYILAMILASRFPSRSGLAPGAGMSTRLRHVLRPLGSEYLVELVRFLFRMFWHRPEHFESAMGFALVGIHYYRFTFEDLIPDVDSRLAMLPPEGGQTGDNRKAPEPGAVPGLTPHPA